MADDFLGKKGWKNALKTWVYATLHAVFPTKYDGTSTWTER